jgi:DNA-binding PadR family transcriptional regulator
MAVTLEFMSASPSLSLAEWTVLALISEAPTHGFAIFQLTAPDGELGRIWLIHRPVVYRSIGRLEEAGLVAPQTVESGQGPQRTIYAATPAGHKAVAAWLDAPVEHIRDVRSHLLIKLALLDRAGADATGLLRRQKAILQPIASAIAKEQPERQGFDATLLAWRRATAAAALSFLNDITWLAAARGVAWCVPTFLGQPPAGLPPYPALGAWGTPGRAVV